MQVKVGELNGKSGIYQILEKFGWSGELVKIYTDAIG